MTGRPENTWSWRHAILQSELPSTTKHVLLTISCYINDVGAGCYPTVKQLAAATSMSERSVCTHIEAARDAGWLAVSKHGFGGQKWKNHEYRPLCPQPVALQSNDKKALNVVQQQGTESVSVASSKALNLLQEGTEANDKKALNVVQSNSPNNNPLNNTLSETSSDETRKEKKRISYPDHFEALWKTYPTHQNMSKKEAFDAWRKLDEVDKTAALEAVSGYKAFLAKKPDTEVIHLCRFITKRRFDGYTSHQGSTATPQMSTDADWHQRLNYARKERLWSVERWGAIPKTDGCIVPPHLLAPTDGDGWKIFEKR